MIEHPRTLNRPHLGREEVGVTGAGANFTWTPTVRTHVEVISVFMRLVTDATGINRLVRLAIGGIADDDAIILADGFHGPNATYDYWFLRGLGYRSGAPALTGWNGGLPMGLLFSNPEQLRSDVYNLQAGDQITLHTIRYMEWKDPVWAG